MGQITEIVKQMKADARLFGNKAAANLAFDKLGIGLSVSVFLPNASLESIREQLLRRDFRQKMVVRFSKLDVINLPIAFGLKGVKSVLDFIKNKRKKGFSTIVCPQFDIFNAFEIYCYHKTIFVSVLPGKWDVCVKELTDTIAITPKYVKIMRYLKNRSVKGRHEKVAKPFSFEELKKIAEFVLSKQTILTSLKKVHNPVFIRGWQDCAGTFCFANFRERDCQVEFHRPRSPLFNVCTEEDVQYWDGETAIYFDACAAERENDQVLYALAKRLLQKGAKKICCNSVLSHQAIILREAGLETEQLMNPSDYEITVLGRTKNGF